MSNTVYQDAMNTQREVLELGMFCKKFEISKADLQNLASQKIRATQKKND